MNRYGGKEIIHSSSENLPNLSSDTYFSEEGRSTESTDTKFCLKQNVDLRFNLLHLSSLIWIFTPDVHHISVWLWLIQRPFQNISVETLVEMCIGLSMINKDLLVSQNGMGWWLDNGPTLPWVRMYWFVHLQFNLKNFPRVHLCFPLFWLSGIFVHNTFLLSAVYIFNIVDNNNWSINLGWDLTQVHTSMLNQHCWLPSYFYSSQNIELHVLWLYAIRWGYALTQIIPCWSADTCSVMSFVFFKLDLEILKCWWSSSAPQTSLSHPPDLEIYKIEEETYSTLCCPTICV